MCGGDGWEADSPASSPHQYEHSRPPVSCYMEGSSREFEANLFKFQTLCGLFFLLCSTFTTTSNPALILSTVEPPWSASQFLELHLFIRKHCRADVLA